MELLAPAGDPVQALKSIEAGCDALYGGLKTWNARRRAENFSMEQYRQILQLCHKKEISFYLTLNTLYRDEELRAIRELFQSADFPRPDAVLVADLGLIRMLRREFPDVVLHASTQFGAYTPDDLAFLEKYGVTRVVLAREMTLSEIKALRRSTSMELEVFVYGSQCLCFSGQCLWGGLMDGCSGNRGRCSAMCRDIYRKDGFSGQFMYPRDICAVDLVETLKDIGVDSVKIEGRLRDSDETAAAVQSFRRAIDAPARDAAGHEKKNYAGYLSDAVPVKHMLNAVNPRVLPEKTDCCRNACGSGDFKPEREERSSAVRPRPLDMIMQTDDAGTVREFQKAGGKKYIFEIKSRASLEEALREEKEDVTAIYKLPVLDFNHALDEILPLLKGKRVLAGRVSQLALKERYGFSSVYADYTIHAWNTCAAELLKERGAAAFTASPELSEEYAGQVSEKTGLPYFRVVWGNIPLGFTRACFGELGLCDGQCENSVFRVEHARRGHMIEARCDNAFGYRSIHAGNMFAACSAEGRGECRYILSGLTPDEQKAVLRGDFSDFQEIMMDRGNVD